MKQQRVAVSMIAGDDWRPEEIKPLLASLEPHCHGLYVNWNGTTRKPRWGAWTSMPIHYVTTTWTDDFAAARNAAYKAIPKKDYDWWMWVDSDDILVAPEGFAPVFESLDEYTRGVFVRYAYAVEPTTGQVVVEQWRERLLSTKWFWQWRWPIHEVCAAPLGTQFEHAEGELAQKVFIQHQRTSGDERGARARNRRIIMKALRDHPQEPKFAYYYAREAMAEAMVTKVDSFERTAVCDAAIQAYRKFLSMGMQANDDTYLASCSIGDLFAMKGDFTGAVDAYLQAARSYPDWPNAWLGCAKALLFLKDWSRMRTFADIASKLPRPQTTAAVEAMDFTFTPLLLRGIANEELGRFDEAVADYKAARKIYDDPTQKLGERIKAIAGKSKAEKPEDKQREQRKRTRGTKPEKSIAFYTNPIAETWNQETLAAGGHGGSETMVLEMAPRFAADGWRVCVFGCPGTERGLGGDGVEYWRSEDWNAAEHFKIFVSSRALSPFAGPISADRTLLWLHDVNVGPSLRDVAGRPDMLVPVSNWQAGHFQALYGIPGEKMHPIPNGIDLALYPERTDHPDGHRFVWSSSPDRGLEHLLALWPLIRERWSDAELHVFYGWEFIDKVIESTGNHPLVYFKHKVGLQWANNGGEKAGLHWHGRVSPAQLAQEQLKSDLWAYPTNFMETFCITAIQAQAAGALPLTTALSALNETVACDWLKLNGWAANVDYQRRYLELLEGVLDETEAAADLRAQARRAGRAFAENYTLDAAYAKWNDLFTTMGV